VDQEMLLSDLHGFMNAARSAALMIGLPFLVVVVPEPNFFEDYLFLKVGVVAVAMAVVMLPLWQLRFETRFKDEHALDNMAKSLRRFRHSLFAMVEEKVKAEDETDGNQTEHLSAALSSTALIDRFVRQYIGNAISEADNNTTEIPYVQRNLKDPEHYVALSRQIKRIVEAYPESRQGTVC
jgi:hypothetical protein